MLSCSNYKLASIIVFQNISLSTQVEKVHLSGNEVEVKKKSGGHIIPKIPVILFARKGKENCKNVKKIHGCAYDRELWTKLPSQSVASLS